MESSTDSYLHKKFKKQLTIEPRPLSNDKENKETSKSDPSEAKRQVEEVSSNSVTENQKLPDNNDSVPNQSTNHSSSFTTPVQNSNFLTSSISLESSQSLNQCISYVVSTNHLNERLPASFDTKYSDQVTNFVSSTSSILDNYYSARPNYVTEDPYSYDCTLKQDEPIDIKLEEVHEVQPPPDKSSGGKYVCPYCSMVCSKPSVLQKHIRAHTNERPYPCKSCGFSFKTRSNLYKHCRSRTHANRVMGNKMQDSGGEPIDNQRPVETSLRLSESRDDQMMSQKPYKPRFHNTKEFFENVSKENIEEDLNHSKHPTSDMLSYHINEIISKNNSIVNSSETLIKKRTNDESLPNSENRYLYRIEPAIITTVSELKHSDDQPLNLTNKNRKRAMSEVSEPVIHKSLIKELLLKNLSSSDMQCQYCKMIFQTVTELDIHKYRSCKGKPSGIKYTRSSSVNVASILTQNKNAFDNIPQLQNTVFPLNSPGPFLGKTRLVDSDKSKSFSFDSGNLPLMSPSENSPSFFSSSPLQFEKEKKPVKFFGGEVKVQSSGETKSFKMDRNNDTFEPESNYIEYGGKLSENRVIKSSLQSGGTVLTSKTSFPKQDLKAPQEVIRVYENTSISPSIDISNFTKQRFTFDRTQENISSDSTLSKIVEVTEPTKSYSNEPSPLYKYTNIMDFSQNAVKMLTPNIKQPSFSISNVLLSNKPPLNNICVETSPELKLHSPKPKMNLSEQVRIVSDVESAKKQILQTETKNVFEPKPLYNPLNLLVNGKVVRHVPGMPGPVVAAENPVEMTYSSNIIAIGRTSQSDIPKSPVIVDKVPSTPKIINNCIQPEQNIERSTSGNVEVRTSEVSSRVPELKLPLRISESKSIENKSSESEIKKFARPNSLALKPTTAALKQHHGLTPTMFNQILISPDTPRVAKKYAEHFLHGNYFSYLGLKSSTKPVYCTLNKTQPFYVPHFKKLSMYSEWRQQDTKQDKLYVSNYDSRQKNQRYTVAGKPTANLIMHSSYKFMVSEMPLSKNEKEEQKNVLPGGYECNDDYTYIRGRGRGRYVCDQCGIRCKKPSMLKKHIRTHSNDRPYTCNHCNFSFKTKGNLTKHMKSKAHTKNYTASSGSSSSTQQSEHSPQTSDSDTEDSGMDSSDESTRQQEHEAAYGLLSLSQKPTQGSMGPNSDLPHLSTPNSIDFSISTEEVAYVSKTNYAKNKFLDERNSSNFSSKKLNEVPTVVAVEETTEALNVRNYLGKCSISRPLTYPYTMLLPLEKEALSSPKPSENINRVSNPISVDVSQNIEIRQEPKSIKQFHVIQKYMPQAAQLSPKVIEKPNLSPRKLEPSPPISEKVILNNKRNLSPNNNRPLPTLKLNDMNMVNENVSDLRKRKFPVIENTYKNKIQRNDEVMDLSMTTNQEKLLNGVEERVYNNTRPIETPPKNVANEIYNTLHKVIPTSPQRYDVNEDKEESLNHKTNDCANNNGTVIILRPLQTEEQVNVNYTMDHQVEEQSKIEYDNSAMETLADVATKQVKLEKNSLAKNVASEFLKLATKNENLDGCIDSGKFGPTNKDVNDLIVKSEGNKSCTICAKNFNKPSQLRLHMNIHYLERPFRCDSCSVSFRTKGHLQKHERSASHHNKLSSSPALSSSEPRPFKCSDCNIAFRIHGHLAKHLRSKMHIMKLECLAKVPFGLYAELERSNSLLTEINTSDGEQCLESLKTLAKKVFIKDPSKLNQLELRENVNNADC